MKGLYVLFWFIVLRIASVFLVRTFYVPDEYWQSLEVAHKLTYGYGHLTWEWTAGIRNYIHPAIFAGVFKILQLLNVECSCIFALLPRVLQALLTAYSDYRFYNLCGKSKWSIFIISIGHFWFYTGSRTLINTFEASLTTIALSFYPWKSENNGFLWIVGLLCFIRPTAAIPWIPLCINHIISSKFSAIEVMLKRYLPIGIATGGLAIGVDYLIYGDLVLTPINFLKVNVLQNIGSFYGTHPWFWYISTGLPAILGIFTIPFLLSIYDTLSNDSKRNFPIRRQLIFSISFTVFIFSLLNHKEFRFLLPILPMAFYLIADYLSRVSRKLNDILVWFIAIALLIGNALPIWYLGYVHQKGTLDVMPKLATIAREFKDESGNNASIYFFMPCHSTPFYSHVHRNITMQFLSCEPNLTNSTNYVDEADVFYENPSRWIDKNIPIHPIDELPTHLVMFDVLEPKILKFLGKYKRIFTIPHSEMVPSDRVGHKVLVFERKNPQAAPEQPSPSSSTKPKPTPPVKEDSLDEL